MKLIIVDSGVDIEHEVFRGRRIQTYTYRKGVVSEGCVDSVGHGTGITGVIAAACRNLDLQITVMAIDGIEEGIEEDELRGVLAYIESNMDCDIINLSMGITVCENNKELYEVCRKLTEKGVVIMSAFDNDGAISYPAAFDNVIGVTNDGECNKIDQFVFLENSIVNLGAKGGVQRVPWNTPRYAMISGNSFACAHATAQTVKFMADGNRTQEAILSKFRENAIKYYKHNGEISLKRQLFDIQKAVLFPFNKEMHSLVRYHELLTFEITGIYDSRYSAKVGALTTRLMGDNAVSEYEIQDVSNINWESFDTLIMGHLDELSKVTQCIGLKNTLVEQAIAHGKKIYAFDDIRHLAGEREDVYCPVVDAGMLYPNFYGKLYKISKPVLGVFGTSSRQGKFTLQLKLRELFQKKGYKIGQVGTEPSALLYGMDYVYPIGYNSSVYIKEYDAVRYLNGIMNDLCRAENDLIIVGSQAGTISCDAGNLDFYNFPQYEFLLGTQPDAVILVVNPFDEPEQIIRTIRFVESAVDNQVIALVVFPLTLDEGVLGYYGKSRVLSEESFYKVKTELQNKINLPVYRLGIEEDMRMLTEDVISFF